MSEPLLLQRRAAPKIVVRHDNRMTASEQMHFLGAPLAHVLAWEETLRERRRQIAIARLVQP